MTNYEEFKAIADDIAEMYANGYAEYAEYFSETFTGIGELSAVTRMSDKLYALRHTDVKDPWYTDNLKEIAIDAILAIGEIDIVRSKVEEAGTYPALKHGYRYYCYKTYTVGSKDVLQSGCTYLYDKNNGLINFATNSIVLCDVTDCWQEYLQKIIEKK